MSSGTFDPTPFHDFEQQGWDSTAGLYDTYFGSHTSNYRDALLDAAGVGAGTRVLDLACGPGYVTAAAAARGARVTGADFAPNMVAEARRLHPGCRFEVGDAEALGHADASFDAVVMSFGMLHVARPEAAAAEALRVLVAGGRFAFSVWDDPATRAPAMGIVNAAISRHAKLDVGIPDGPPMFRFADDTESRQLMEGAGFASVRIDRVSHDWVVDSADAVFVAFRDAGVRAGALLRAQEPDALEAIAADVRQAAGAYRVGERYAFPTGAVLVSGARPAD